MDILDFYKRLSKIIENYNKYNHEQSLTSLRMLLEEAKENDLEVNVSENIIKDFALFKEETSYDDDNNSNSSYDNDSNSSYDNDSNSSYDNDSNSSYDSSYDD